MPAVTAWNRPDSQPLVYRARIPGGATSARLELSNNGGNIVLLDNGVAPDTVAGDFVFSGTVLPSVLLSRNVPGRANKPIVGRLQPLVNGVPTALRANVVGAVAAQNLPAYPVTTVVGAQAARRFTEYVVAFRDDAFANDFNVNRIAQRFYTIYRDEFDFIDFVYMPRGYLDNRFHAVVRNSVTGIGLGAINDGASYGSAARLIGRSNYPTLSFYGHSPSYVHEIGHQWINHLGGAFDDPRGVHFAYSPLAEDIMGKSGSSGQGEDQSCRLTLEAGGVRATPRVQGTSFNPWEMYLMGFGTAAEVPASFSITDQVAFHDFVLSNPGWCNGQLLNVATIPLTIQGLVAANGARVPGAATARRWFKVATIVVTIGRDLDDNEMRFITEEARRIMQPGTQPYAEGLIGGDAPTFNGATGGRAFFETRLDVGFANGFE